MQWHYTGQAGPHQPACHVPAITFCRFAWPTASKEEVPNAAGKVLLLAGRKSRSVASAGTGSAGRRAGCCDNNAAAISSHSISARVGWARA